eukprot:2263063-Lingulodinium_polyedra.AAC.1
MPTLDTPFRQVLLRYPQDPRVRYHHRCLVIAGPDGRWVGITPDHEVQVFDLQAEPQNVIPLKRNAPFPRTIDPGDIYAFDEFENDEEAELRE